MTNRKNILNKTQLNQLALIFKAEDIEFACQFGSSVTGHMNSTSDLDIAVYFSKKYSNKKLFAKRLKLIHQLSVLLKCEVDLVVINQIKSILLRYQVIAPNKLIYCRNKTQAYLFFSRIMSEYFDFQPFLKYKRKSYVARYN